MGRIAARQIWAKREPLPEPPGTMGGTGGENFDAVPMFGNLVLSLRWGQVAQVSRYRLSVPPIEDGELVVPGGYGYTKWEKYDTLGDHHPRMFRAAFIERVNCAYSRPREVCRSPPPPRG